MNAAYETARAALADQRARAAACGEPPLKVVGE